MRRLFIALLFTCTSFNSIAQKGDSLDFFSTRFKMDSLGRLGIRVHYVIVKQSLNNQADSVFVNGLYLKGYSKEWILQYLGKPTSTHPSVIEPYYDSKYIIENSARGAEELYVFFDKKDKVSFIEIMYVF